MKANTVSNTQNVSSDKTANVTSNDKSSAISLNKGESFVGQIKDVRPGQMTILLNNGNTLAAKTDGQIGSIGEMALFNVKDTNRQILIEMIKSLSGGHIDFAKEALRSSGLPVSEENIKLVLELMENGVALSQKTLESAVFFNQYGHMNKSASSLKTSIDAILFLLSEKLPNDLETAQAYTRFASGKATVGQHSSLIIKHMTNITDETPLLSLIKAVSSSGVFEKADGLMKETFFEQLNSKSEYKNTDLITNLFKQMTFLKLEGPVNQSAIKNVYNDIYKFAKSMKHEADTLLKNDSSYSERTNRSLKAISQVAKTVIENIKFSDKIQTDKMLLSLPFFTGQTQNEGVVHIFRNDEEKNNRGDNPAYALVSLNFPYLGLVESLISKNGKKSLEICLYAESKDVLELFEKNVVKLRRLLREKGLSASVSYKKLIKKTEVFFYKRA